MNITKTVIRIQHTYAEKISNEDILKRVRGERNLLKTIQYRRGEMFGYLLRNEEFVRIIIEGKIEGKIMRRT